MLTAEGLGQAERFLFRIGLRDPDPQAEFPFIFEDDGLRAEGWYEPERRAGYGHSETVRLRAYPERNLPAEVRLVQPRFKPSLLAALSKAIGEFDVFARSLALTLLAAPALVAAAPVQQSDLAQVQQHLAGLSSMTANFSQTDRNGRTLAGVMTLKRPGKIRFQYEKGVPQLIVADGRSLYFIDYQVRQVDRWPIGNSPLAVLLDPKRDIGKFAKVKPTGNPGVISVEVHDPRHPEYGRITMIFQKGGSAGLSLQGWVALDSQNNRTTVRLSNQRYNAPVSDGTFRWNDPRKGSGRR